MLPTMPSNSPSIGLDPVISRRKFLATSSAAMLAGAIAPAQSEAAESAPVSNLALHGGEKTVKYSMKLPVRWGEPERDRLNAMLAQDSLFYWKGPQTTLLIER